MYSWILYCVNNLIFWFLVFLGFSTTDWVKAACAPCQSPGAHRTARPSPLARPPARLPASPVWMNEATAGPFSQLLTVTLISMYDAPSDKYGTFLPRERWTCEKLWATWGPAILPPCVQQKEKSMLFFQRFNGLTPFPFISKAYTTILHVHLWIFCILKGIYEVESEKVELDAQWHEWTGETILLFCVYQTILEVKSTFIPPSSFTR